MDVDHDNNAGAFHNGTSSKYRPTTLRNTPGPVRTSMLSQEARFLEAREAWTARPRRKAHQDLHDFCSALREDIRQWESRLDALLQEEHPHTASQRKESIEKLHVLLADLQNLRRQCLSSTDIELPPADVRLLYEEFTNLSTRLDQARDEIVPPTKFTFKRYRAAMRSMENSTEMKQKTNVSTKLPSRLTFGGRVIQDHCDASLILDKRSLSIQTSEETIVRQEETDTSSLLLKNLKRCRVTINGSYKALHIQNVTNCVIHVTNTVDGAIHVTACQEIILYATCHQLRMHESTHLGCHVKVGSGPILEDCTDIVFNACQENDLVYDAKDFNWLRNGIPSPNFRIVKESDEETDLGPSHHTTSNPIEQGSEEAVQPSTTTSSNVAESDEEDEL